MHLGVPVSAITFAAPRVSNQAFRDGLNSCSGVRVLHVIVKHDIVPIVLESRIAERSS
jgi:hypothetical protein